MLFPRAGNVAKISFVCIVHKHSPQTTCVCNNTRSDARAIQTVFGDGVELFGVAIEAALHGECVGNILDADVLWFRVEDVEHLAGVSLGLGGHVLVKHSLCFARMRF